MIATERVKKIVEEQLSGSDKFLVDIKVNGGNCIHVAIDGDMGVTVDDCIQLSRHIEKELNRDIEDFELNVSSPGAENPVKEIRQVIKAIGKVFKATLNDGREIQGVLKSVNGDTLTIETAEKIKPEGKKSKQLVVTQHQLVFSEIKQLKRVILFK